MNLQCRALYAFMQANNKYDDENVFLKNVLFDANNFAQELDDEIIVLEAEISAKEDIVSEITMCRNIIVNEEDMSAYSAILDIISDYLFDTFTYDIITTDEQLDWKEYLHGLYDAVIVPYHEDRLHNIQMMNALYVYYDILEKPEPLGQMDKLFPHVKYCRDLFAGLKIMHEKLIILDLKEQLNENMKILKKSRMEIIKLKLIVKNKKDLKNLYIEILKWSVV